MKSLAPAASVADLRQGRGIKVSFDDEDVALFLIGEEVFAVGNHCPHQHHSSLHDGTLDGTVVTCPMHGWSFDLRSGGCTNGSGKLKQFTVEVRGKSVFLEPPKL